jgi:hypothetical protein
MSENPLVPVELIERRIYLIRGQKVMLDSDLAELYQVQTFRLNEQVKRNRTRFPQDFMFQLTKEETRSLTSQSARSKPRRGGRRAFPYAFTEQGVAMLSTVLNSDRAIYDFCSLKYEGITPELDENTRACARARDLVLAAGGRARREQVPDRRSWGGIVLGEDLKFKIQDSGSDTR